jgi:hypothetical protein
MHHPTSSHAPVAPKSEVHTQKVYTFLHEDGKKKRKLKTNGESPTLQQGKEQCAIVAKQQNNYILSENVMFHK